MILRRSSWSAAKRALGGHASVWRAPAAHVQPRIAFSTRLMQPIPHYTSRGFAAYSLREVRNPHPSISTSACMSYFQHPPNNPASTTIQAVDDVEGTDEEDNNYEGQPQLLPDRIGFIGAGQMGEALIKGFTAAGITVPDHLCASVRSEERRHAMQGLGLTVGGCWGLQVWGLYMLCVQQQITVFCVIPEMCSASHLW